MQLLKNFTKSTQEELPSNSVVTVCLLNTPNDNTTNSLETMLPPIQLFHINKKLGANRTLEGKENE